MRGSMQSMEARMMIRARLTRYGVGAGMALLALAVVPASGMGGAGAQERDSRWLPWTGCWAPAEGNDGPAVCVLPAAEGVEIVTVAGNQVVSRRSVVADGVTRPVDHEGCWGEETASFSPDGRRIYLSAEFRCEGGSGRRTSGIMAMVPDEEWLDVNVVEVEGQSASWVQRYLPTLPSVAVDAGLPAPAQDLGAAVRTSRLRASASPGVDDVVEASAMVAPEAVEAWLAERAEPLPLNAAGLIRLADAGVPERTIDVAVAVSNPQRFVMDRGGPSARLDGPAGRPPIRAHAWIPLDPWVASYRRPYGWGYGYGSAFMPWGYGPAWGFGYGYRPPVIIVDTQAPPPPPPGRVVRFGEWKCGAGRAPGACPPARSTGGQLLRDLHG